MLNIHQIAFTNRGKIKKEEAAKLILELAAQYPDAVPKLGLLLALLQPPAQKADTVFAWVAKAVANQKELRKYLRYVMCDGQSLVATDGTMLFAAPCGDRAAGLYDPKTGEKIWLLECDYPEGETPSGHPGRWPEWQRVMSRPADRDLNDANTDSVTFGKLQKDVTVRGPNGSTIKLTQWEAALLRCNRCDWGTAPHSNSVYFEGSNGERSVVMPYRKKYLEEHQ